MSAPRGLFSNRRGSRRLLVPHSSDSTGGEDGASACSGQNKANGIPDWEDPLGNSLSDNVPGAEPMPARRTALLRSGSVKGRRKAPTRQPPQHHRSLRTNSSGRPVASVGQKPPPSPIRNPALLRHHESHYGQEKRFPDEHQTYDQRQEYEQHNGYSSRRLENMVIECDDVEHCSVGEITYDGSVMYDHGNYPDDDPYYQPRNSQVQTPRTRRTRSGDLRRQSRQASTKEPRRSASARLHVVADETTDDRNSGGLSLDEEERRLVELAMERSLQEVASHNSSRMSANEVSEPESMEFGSSRGGSLTSASSHDPRYDQRHPYERQNLGERPSFVWKRDGKKWKKVPVASSDGLQAIKERDDSSRRPSHLSREEQLEIMEQRMFDEAMQRSLSVADLHGGSSRSLIRGPHYSSSACSDQPGSNYGSPRNVHDYVDEDDGIDEEEAMARLRELEEEKSRLKRAMQRRALDKKSSRRSRSSDTLSTTPSDQSSMHGENSIYDGEHNPYDSDHPNNARHVNMRPYQDVNQNGVLEDDRNSDLRIRKPAIVGRTYSTESTNSQGQKTVWKKDSRGVWGRYSDEQIDSEDEESMLADALMRSMHDQ